MTSQYEITSINTTRVSLKPPPRPQLASGWMPHWVGRLASLSLTILLALAPQTVYAAERLTICYGSPFATLVPLAKLRGFYAAEGLDVEVRNFPSGRQSLEAMFAGKCAMATVTEPPVVHQSLIRKDFRILAAIAESSDFNRMIVRSDRGILTPADLRGHRIAVPQFTSSHYFLDIYLAVNGLGSQDVTKVYLPAQEVALAFRRGEVDAAAHWEPNIQMMAGESGAKTKIFTAPGLHIVTMMLVGELDFVRKKPAVVERVLRALLRAERYAKEQPANTRALMASDYAMAQSEIDFVWPLYSLRVSLGQPLLFILENTARWEIGLLPPEKRPAVPNYLDFIYLDGLKAVKPEAVTIIH